MKTYKDAHHRSLLKALSWRVCATFTTMLIVFAFTREFILSASVDTVEVVTKLILYYLHERIWGSIGIGTKAHPLSVLPVERPLEEKDMEVVKTSLRI